MSGNHDEISPEAAAKLLQRGLDSRGTKLLKKKVEIESEVLDKLCDMGYLSPNTIQKIKYQAIEEGSAYILWVPDDELTKTLYDVLVAFVFAIFVGSVVYCGTKSYDGAPVIVVPPCLDVYVALWNGTHSVL